jgi:hypothetical protein
MKAIKIPIILACLMCLAIIPLRGQSSMPEIFDEGTLEEQYEYLHERTRIYNNFRAIREDMFQKIRTNSLDSLAGVKNNVLQLENQLDEANALITSQQSDLEATNSRLDEAIKNRDKLTFLWIPMNKVLYNSIVWIIIGGLAFLSGVLFLTNRRLLITARRNKRDLEETREEFEAHRKQARERYEHMVVKHHNELRKLKGN